MDLAIKKITDFEIIKKGKAQDFLALFLFD